VDSPDERELLAGQFDFDHILERLDESGSYAINYTIGGKYNRRLRYYYLDDTKQAVIFTSQDITDLLRERERHEREIARAREAVTAANELKTDFLGYISHDLRTPLNAIMGYSTLLREKETGMSETGTGYLDKIDNAAGTLMALIEDTLDLQKLETGEATLELRDEKCSEVMESLVASIEPMLEEKHLHFIFDHTQKAGVRAWVDKKKLQRILLNLLTNAIKYTDEGGEVEFKIACEAQDDQKVHDVFTIRDTGVGMSEEFLAKMFEPYAQERTKTNARMTGVGLGLPIALRLTGMMGGRIEVESAPGKGSTFRVYLSFDKVQEVRETKAHADAPLAGIRILMCEDNEMNAEIAVAMLEDEGACVDVATDGSEGVRMFEAALTGDYDLILMDLRMPVMDGYEAAIRIRESAHPNGRVVPIMALSADAYESDVLKSKEAGMDAHIAKPFDPDKTVTEILRLLHKD